MRSIGGPVTFERMGPVHSARVHHSWIEFSEDDRLVWQDIFELFL